VWPHQTIPSTKYPAHGIRSSTTCSYGACGSRPLRISAMTVKRLPLSEYCDETSYMRCPSHRTTCIAFYMIIKFYSNGCPYIVFLDGMSQECWQLMVVFGSDAARVFVGESCQESIPHRGAVDIAKGMRKSSNVLIYDRPTWR
jgi:hypothetical protein